MEERSPTKSILVTGGTGLLGREFAKLALHGGHKVWVMSRSSRRRDLLPTKIGWLYGDLEMGIGLDDAVAGTNVIIHAGTSPFSKIRETDVEGTRLLLKAARQSGRIEHFIFPSIVGIENIPLNYYVQKLAAERTIREGGVPWTVLRATQFHSFIDMILVKASKSPVILLPTDFLFQPVDAREVAARLLQCIVEGPVATVQAPVHLSRFSLGEAGAGRRPDFCGPEVKTLGELARIWLDVRKMKRAVVRLPTPGDVAAAFRRGEGTAPDKAGSGITWYDWVKNKYRETVE